MNFSRIFFPRKRSLTAEQLRVVAFEKLLSSIKSDKLRWDEEMDAWINYHYRASTWTKNYHLKRNIDQYTLWVDGVKVEFTKDQLQELLSQIEDSIKRFKQTDEMEALESII